MKTINDLKDNEANDMESGYYQALVEVDKLIYEMLKEEDCHHLEELKSKLNGEKKK